MITRTTTRWTYTPNGVTTSFAFDNLVQAAGDLQVTWWDASGNALVLPSYAVTGVGSPTGGTVVFATAPAAVAGSLIVLERVSGSVTTGADQQDFIQEQAASRQFYRDKSLALAQEAARKFTRTFVLSPLDPDGGLVLPPPALRANKALLFGPDGAPVVGSPLTTGAATISAFVQTLLDDPDAAAFLTTLGFSTFMKAQRTADAAALLTALGVSSYASATLLALADAAALRTAAGVGGGRVSRFINGDFAIDQRNEGASQALVAAAAIAYGVDRWYASCTGANISAQRVAGTGANQFAWRLTGAASNTGFLFGQRIEARDIADLVSQDVTVSLSVKSSALASLTWKAYYANAADDFSAKTLITSGTISGISAALAAKSERKQRHRHRIRGRGAGRGTDVPGGGGPDRARHGRLVVRAARVSRTAGRLPALLREELRPRHRAGRRLAAGRRRRQPRPERGRRWRLAGAGRLQGAQAGGGDRGLLGPKRERQQSLLRRRRLRCLHAQRHARRGAPQHRRRRLPLHRLCRRRKRDVAAALRGKRRTLGGSR